MIFSYTIFKYFLSTLGLITVLFFASCANIPKSNDSGNLNQGTFTDSTKILSQKQSNPNAPVDRIITNGAHFRTIQNSGYDWVDIYFDFDNNTECLVSLNTIIGQELVSKTVKVHRGRNSTRLTTADIPSGIYQVIINIDGITKTGTISINR